jgi:hypothetical protein
LSRATVPTGTISPKLLRAFKLRDVLSVLPERAVGLRNHDGSSPQFDADPLARPSGGHSGRAWLAYMSAVAVGLWSCSPAIVSDATLYKPQRMKIRRDVT